MRVLVIIGLVVFVAAFLGAWIAMLVMARKAAKARQLREREGWRDGQDGSTPGGPGAAAWMPLGVAGMLGAAAATDANAEQRQRASHVGDGGTFVDPGVHSNQDTTPDAGEGGWGDAGGSDGVSDGDGGGGGE